MAKTYQYIGAEYTMIRLKDGEDKVKVTQGEIVDTDRFSEKQMLRSGFQIADTKAPKTEKKETKKSK